jgi:hypothetical protein
MRTDKQLRASLKEIGELGISDRLHLWPDNKLGSKWAIDSMPQPGKYRSGLEDKWTRISKPRVQRSAISL